MLTTSTFTQEYKKAQLVCTEVSKYAKSFEQECDLQQQIIALQHSGKEINLQTIDSLNSIEIYDAYLDCKANYPQEFPTTSTPVQEEVKKVEKEVNNVNYLLWDKIGSSHYHAFITLPHFKYGLTISKEEGRWLIWGEDHEVTDFDENLDWQGKVVGFKTLWEAKEAAEEIKESMQECADEAWGEEKEEKEVKKEINKKELIESRNRKAGWLRTIERSIALFTQRNDKYALADAIKDKERLTQEIKEIELLLA